MKQIDFKFFVDTSIWLEYFTNKGKGVVTIIDNDNILHSSVLTLFEMKRKLLREKIDREKINQIMNFVKKRSIVISLSQEVCEKAAEISHHYALPAVDSLIYTTSFIHNCTLVTLDSHFKNIKQVLLL